MAQVWEVAIDCGNFNYLKDDKFPALSKPNKSYNNIKFSETFEILAMRWKLKRLLRDLGCSLSPQNAFNILNGLETLHLEERTCINTKLVANFLHSHPKVYDVSYAD